MYERAYIIILSQKKQEYVLLPSKVKRHAEKDYGTTGEHNGASWLWGGVEHWRTKS